MSILGEITI